MVLAKLASGTLGHFLGQEIGHMVTNLDGSNCLVGPNERYCNARKIVASISDQG